MPDPSIIAATARASYDAAAQAGAGSGHGPARLAASRAIAAGVIDQLVTDATSAARRAIPTGSEAAAGEVWRDLLDTLAGDDLPPRRFCGRSGRDLGPLTPDGWGDYLAAIATLGDTRAGDDARGRLYAALLAQLGHTVAPAVLTTSGASLAMIRATSPADYLCIAIGQLWPAPSRGPGAQSLGLAQRAAKLGAARAAMLTLPDAALQYACEVVTLYLANVRRPLLPARADLLAYYGDDWLAPWASVAALGHFCGRLVQTLTHLIAARNARPLHQLTASDLRSLRIHWLGVRAYQDQRAARAAYRQAIADAAYSATLTRGDKAAIRLTAALPTPGGFDDFAASLLDTLDLQAATAAMGRTIPIAARGAQEAGRARDVITAYRAPVAQVIDTGAGNDDLAALLDMGGVLDLADMLATGALPADLLPTIDSEDDLITAGLLSVSDVLDWQDEASRDYDDDDDSDDDSDPGEGLDLSALMADAARLHQERAGMRRAPLAKPAKPAPRRAVPVLPLDGLSLGGQADAPPAPVPVAPDPAPVPAKPGGFRPIGAARAPSPAAPAAPAPVPPRFGFRPIR